MMKLLNTLKRIKEDCAKGISILVQHGGEGNSMGILQDIEIWQYWQIVFAHFLWKSYIKFTGNLIYVQIKESGYGYK